MAIFMAAYYGKPLLSPNNYLFNASGDAIKNYYTYANHIKNDSSYLQFNGMNYPYGEHFFYTDGHPLISNTLKSISMIFPGITDYSIGIINFFMLFSFFLAAFLLWHLLLRFKVKPVLSVLGAIGITLLAPQVFRMTGHLSLSYSFFIPLTFLLTFKSFDSKRGLLWPVLLMINNIFWFFIHAYLGMMAVFFVLSYWFVILAINYKTEIKKRWMYLYLLVCVVFPIFLFRIILFFTDSHLNRTTNPSGFFLYNAEPDDILIPHHPPLRPILDRFISIDLEWEAWSYIGVVGIFIVLFILINTFRNLFKHKKFELDKKFLPKGEIKITLWASVILLIFAFGFPFKIFPVLLDVLPDIKNFRATGRFAWFFYFAISIAGIVIVDNISKLLKNKNRIIISRIFMVVMPMLMIIEGIPYHGETSYYIDQNPNMFRQELLSDDLEEIIQLANNGNYQSILPLPFYYVGSENFTRPINDNSARNSMLVSYHTGLSICGAYLTRTGISESKKIVQLMSPDFYEKEIRFDLASNDPFIIIKSENNLTQYEKTLIDKADLLWKGSSFELYQISPEILFESSAEKEIVSFLNIKDKLYENDGFLVTDSSTVILFKKFDDKQSDFVFSGKGSFNGYKKESNLIAEFSPGVLQEGKEYIASTWMYNGQLDALNFWFRFIFEEYDQSAEHWEIIYTIPEQSEVIDGDWSLVELQFKVINSNNPTCIKTLGKTIDKLEFYLDDLLIREKGVDVFKPVYNEDGSIRELFKNNHRIRISQD